MSHQVLPTADESEVLRLARRAQERYAGEALGPGELADYLRARGFRENWTRIAVLADRVLAAQRALDHAELELGVALGTRAYWRGY